MKSIRDNTYKKIITDNICNKIGIPNSYIAKIVNDIISILILNLREKKKLKIKNFGTFFVKNKNKRTGRNPKNKIIHEITERNVVTFKLSKYLKDKLNTNVR
jgi:nucleoid DNA-binding protein